MHAARTLESAVRVCLDACRRCARCRYITVSPTGRDCSWYHDCDLDHLQQTYDGFLSGPSMGASLPRDVTPVLQEVVLFMHLEKTAGTLVRKWMERSRWARTGYCDGVDDIQDQVIGLLERNESRVFVEYHCDIDWGAPAKLLKRIRAFESMSGRRVRFRSFTLLRSPLSLTHSQFAYWHAASILPRRLYYQLSSEMLLFGDALKRLNLNHRKDDVCIAWGEHARAGGIFLGLPFSDKRGASTEQLVCSRQRWNTLCHDVTIAVLRRWVHARQSGLLPARLLQCATTKLDADIRLTNMASGAVSAYYNTAGPGVAAGKSGAVADRIETTVSTNATHEALSSATAVRVKTALGAVPSNATYDELDAALADALCPAARWRLLQVTQCLIGHAENVRETIDEFGCDAIIRQALDRLSQFSHVLFMDASKFTLEHALEMALRGTDKEKANPSYRSLRANVGVSHEPFIQSEVEPFNLCSLRFYGEAFAAYTARVPYFETLAEMDLLRTPIHDQVRTANEESDMVPRQTD